MKYRVKAKEKCVYKNTLHKAGEEFTFEAESEKDLPDYVEVVPVQKMVKENPQGNAAGKIPNGAAPETDKTGGEEAGGENPPAQEAPEQPAGAEAPQAGPETDKKEDKAKTPKKNTSKTKKN